MAIALGRAPRRRLTRWRPVPRRQSGTASPRTGALTLVRRQARPRQLRKATRAGSSDWRFLAVRSRWCRSGTVTAIGETMAWLSWLISPLVRVVVGAHERRCKGVDVWGTTVQRFRAWREEGERKDRKAAGSADGPDGVHLASTCRTRLPIRPRVHSRLRDSPAAANPTGGRPQTLAAANPTGGQLQTLFAGGIHQTAKQAEKLR